MLEMGTARNKITEKTIYFWRKQVVSKDHNGIIRNARISFPAGIFKKRELLPTREKFSQNLPMAEKWIDYSLKFTPSLFFYAPSFHLLVLKIRAVSRKCDLLASYKHSLIQLHIYFNTLSLNSIIWTQCHIISLC